MGEAGLRSPLMAVVDEFRAWWKTHQSGLETANPVRSPLFHYTDANGLAGIIKNQEMWFTSTFHLNDPSELAYGNEIAHAILRKESEDGDKAIKFFCARLEDVLLRQVENAFGFFVTSFSRSQDELGQWRAYADDGRGFAIGLAPRLFQIEDKRNLKPNELVWVADVRYDRNNAENRQRDAIRRAIGAIKRVVAAGKISSEAEGHEFLKKMGIELTASILWNSITTKHSAYQTEAETRLLIVNDSTKLAPYIETRTRGSNLIPFVKSPMPIRADGSITEIVIGPSATLDAEDAVRSLLLSQGLPLTIPVRRSDIPYRSNK